MPDRPPDAPAEPAPAQRPYFSLWATAVFAVLAAVLVALFYYTWSSPLENLREPEASLERLVGRELDFRDALQRAAWWERRLYDLVGNEPETLDDAIDRYNELSDVSAADTVELDRLILMGEAGQLGGAGDPFGRLAALTPDGERMVEWVRAAYLGDPPSRAAAITRLKEIRGELGRDWFSDTLARRIAERAGLTRERAQAAAAIQRRGHALLVRVRLLTGAGAGVILLSGLVLWRAARRPSRARVASAPLPPPWPAADGWGLFVRGAVAYLAVPLAPSFLVGLIWSLRDSADGAVLSPQSVVIVNALAVAAAGLPVLWWTWRCCRAYDLSPIAAFGLRPGPGGAGRVVGFGLALFALSLAGETVLYLGLSAAGVTTHWADGFPENLLWGSPLKVASETAETVLGAPVFEEIIFRGLLFPALRVALPLWPAALLSGALFAAAHGYGVVGFAAVAWSGAIWAVGYERTGSLLPCMLAHALGNLMSSVSFVLLLRL